LNALLKLLFPQPFPTPWIASLEPQRNSTELVHLPLRFARSAPLLIRVPISRPPFRKISQHASLGNIPQPQRIHVCPKVCSCRQHHQTLHRHWSPHLLCRRSLPPSYCREFLHFSEASHELRPHFHRAYCPAAAKSGVANMVGGDHKQGARAAYQGQGIQFRVAHQGDSV
jgi:hypothetical protein